MRPLLLLLAMAAFSMPATEGQVLRLAQCVASDGLCLEIATLGSIHQIFWVRIGDGGYGPQKIYGWSDGGFSVVVMTHAIDAAIREEIERGRSERSRNQSNHAAVHEPRSRCNRQNHR